MGGLNTTARSGIIIKLVALSVFLLFSIQAAEAHRAWGFVCGQSQLPGSPFTSGNLYEIDLTDGSATLLGTPDCGISEELLAGEFVNGVFYALNNTDKTLVTLAEDASCTVIGSLTGFTAGHTVSGLSHNPSTGITYAMSTNVSVTHLYIIDLATGALTYVGNIAGVSGGITLMINDQGDAYVIDISTDAIFPLDLTTATAGAGVQITFNGNPIDLNFAQDADFGCDLDGNIIGVLYTGGGNGRLGTLDPVTGVFIETANLGAEICAFSIDCYVAPPPPLTVPLSNWALYLSALFMLIFMAVRYFRF